MSYGTISSNGTIDTTFSFSNDFSVSRSGTGIYVITFLEWMGTKPMLVITPCNSSPSNGYSAVYTIGTLTDLRYQATVYIYHSTSKADEAFGFEARFGHVLTFDATKNATLSLQPSVISFGSPSTTVLVLSTTIASLNVGGSTSSFTTKLDKGTALLGVGSTMTLSLGASSVSDGHGNTWDLTGYTYGDGSGTTGSAWIDNKATLTIGTGGPATTPELFVVKGTPRSSNSSNHATLSTDPLVRLSSVAPGGLSV